MTLLLDTHTFLWFVSSNPRLTASAKASIEDPTNPVFLSIATAWEIAIKVSIGKLVVGEPLDVFLPGQLQLNKISLLPITLPHILQVAALPWHHRDPFDRLIIAQSQVEAIPVVGADTIFDSYGIQRLW